MVGPACRDLRDGLAEWREAMVGPLGRSLVDVEAMCVVDSAAKGRVHVRVDLQLEHIFCYVDVTENKKYLKYM